MLPSQALAISTQSSLACLPPMLLAARMLGLRDKVVDVTLPLAVALFRATGPGMNIAVPIYLAHLLGLHIGAAAIVAGLAVAVVLEFGSVSLPGQLTYFTSIAPIAVAMGVPVAPLLLFVAVDMIPDIIRTVGNVTMDVAVAAVADRDQRPAIARTRSE
jgi:Na+/H+-dicarboxylate symporter